MDVDGVAILLINEQITYVYLISMGPSINYVRTKGEGGGGVEPLIHFYCILHAKRGGGRGSK